MPFLFFLYWLLASAYMYSTVLVAWVFESRKPGNGPNDMPVWHDHQSRAFFPGDFGLALTFVSGVWLSLHHQVAPMWAFSWWWFVASLALGVISYVGFRAWIRASNVYDERVWKSPSKIWHDLTTFGAYPFMTMWLALPGYIANFNDRTSWFIVAGIGGLLFWCAGLHCDNVTKQVPHANQHPTVWKPLWRRT